MSAGEQMLEQEAMIERVRQICHRDERLAAAMMYDRRFVGVGQRLVPGASPCTQDAP